MVSDIERDNESECVVERCGVKVRSSVRVSVTTMLLESLVVVVTVMDRVSGGSKVSVVATVREDDDVAFGGGVMVLLIVAVTGSGTVLEADVTMELVLDEEPVDCTEHVLLTVDENVKDRLDGVSGVMVLGIVTDTLAERDSSRDIDKDHSSDGEGDGDSDVV